MRFTSTALLLKSLVEKASRGYERVSTIRDQLDELREANDITAANVAQLQDDLAHQRAVLDAIAAEVDVDADSVATEASPSETPDSADSTSQA